MKISNFDYKYFSFDIFDTLVNRNVSSPTKIFSLVEKKYNMEYSDKIYDFVYKRIEFEKQSRNANKNEEISLDNIYSYFKKIYSPDKIKKLMNIEKEIEILLCTPNLEIKKIYNLLLKQKKKIIIVSDMYLDKKTIKEILNKCGYNGYYKLYLSSDLNKTKKSGSIYNYIKKDLDTNNIMHIGDNFKSDFIQSRLSNIKSKLYYPKKFKYNNDIYIDLLENFLSNNENDNYFEKFGFEKLGPFLLMYSKWLMTNVKNRNIKDIYFFSRDGYILKKCFDILYDYNSIKTKYFYASRRAIIVPSLCEMSSIDEMISAIHWDKKFTFFQLIKKFGLDDIDINELLSENNIKYDDVFEIDDLYNNSKIRSLLEQLKSKIIRNSYFEKKEFEKYIKYNNFPKKVAIVDIGWYGNMQKSLEKLYGNDIDFNGFYLGLIPNSSNQKKYSMFGYLFDENHGLNIYEKEKSINSIFELLFTAPHGSVKKYNMNLKEKVELYDYEFQNDDNLKKIKDLQFGAINFIKKFKEIDKYFDFNIDINYISSLITDFGINPSYSDSCEFGNMMFYDNGTKYIARTMPLKNYLFNFKKFINDLSDSYWKVGFLKRIFYFNFPYYKIYKYAKKLKG